MIHLFHQDPFAVHFSNHACGHMTLTEAFDGGFAGVVAHLFFYLGLVVTFLQLNFDEAISGALFVECNVQGNEI